MNLKTTFAALLLATTFFCSCSKSSTTSNGNGTNPGSSNELEIVTTTGSTVFLFTSKSTWDNYVNSSVGSPVYSKSANSTGIATFTDIPAGQYWWYVVNGCQSSVLDSAATMGIVASTGTAVYNVTPQSLGTLIIQNTNTTLSADIYVGGVLIGALAAGYQFTIKNEVAGVNYTIVAKQLVAGVEDGLDTQTITAYVDCGLSTIKQVNP